MFSLIVNIIQNTQRFEQTMKFEVEKMRFLKFFSVFFFNFFKLFLFFNTCIGKEFFSEKEPSGNLP